VGERERGCNPGGLRTREGNRNERERDAEGRENGVYIHMCASFRLKPGEGRYEKCRRHCPDVAWVRARCPVASDVSGEEEG